MVVARDRGFVRHHNKHALDRNGGSDEPRREHSNKSRRPGGHWPPVRSRALCVTFSLVDSGAVSSPAALNVQDLLIHEGHKATAADIQKLERELEGLARVRHLSLPRVQ